MRCKALALLAMMVGLCWTGMMVVPVNAADDVPRMTREELKSRLGAPDLIVVDVRVEGAWKASDSKIKGAVREDPTDVQDWIKQYPKDKTLVFYCS